MAEYKDIHGTTVRNSAGDLSGAKTGELFYDSTNFDFKYQFPNITSAGSWRTGGALNTGRSRPGSAGIQTSALAFGGESPPYRAQTEQYNGSSWTEVNDLNVAKANFTGCGTTTAAGHVKV